MSLLSNTSVSTRILIGFVSVFCLIEIINLLSGRSLNQFGIYPRQLSAFSGIITSPFLHGSLWHFVSNILPLSLFAVLLMQYGRPMFIKVTFAVIVMTGVTVWMFARPAMHIGASGLVYGYFGFLILAGFLSKRIYLVLISILVAALYGSLLWGALPTRGFISWESHLFGLVSGLIAAYWLVKGQKP